MKSNPLLEIQKLGQSIWIDFIRRGMLVSGDLKRYIDEDGVRGVTSNPSIFEKAIDGSSDYAAAVRSLALSGRNVQEIYESLAIDDLRQAADLFRPLYDKSGGGDGFVSMEVSPRLAHDTAGTIREAERLWEALDRPNVFIKVPGTLEGIPAIRQLTGEGINVNVTLLFGLDRYRMAADAYIAGLETLAAQGKPLDRVASVASFFLSRIDVMLDPVLEEMVKAGEEKGKTAKILRGQVAIASAKVAYQTYREIFSGERFRRLAEKGARQQRVLWASTSTKNPAYSDIKYVEALIGPDTINTIPVETLDAYRDHGSPAPRLETGTEEARRVLNHLPEVEIDLNKVTQQLEDDGIEKFTKDFERLMSALEEKRRLALAGPVDTQKLQASQLKTALERRIAQFEKSHFAQRLWRNDPALWKKDAPDQESIRHSLGWLHLAEKMVDVVPELERFAREVKSAGFRRVVHMGMGGSSLAALVFQRLTQVGPDGLPLTVLDTTDPATILKIEREMPLASTLFIVATKSGTTAESLAFLDFFYDKVRAVKGNQAGDNFVVITDPETSLVEQALKLGFRRTFLNFADIGGRYSALSYFGLVPAALMDLDVNELLERALRIEHACAPSVPVHENPGLMLGSFLGECARAGRDKLTLLMPEPLAPLGLWLEQLIAESTGKDGTGILPVVGEDLGEASVYGKDRCFVCIRLAGSVDGPFERRVSSLATAGFPLATITIKDALDLGQEFYRWEIATAVAGSLLGINAFDQPDVQESKDSTNRLLREAQEKGYLPEERPILIEGPLRFYAGGRGQDARSLLSRFFNQSRPGDYVAIQAFLTESPQTTRALQSIRHLLRNDFKLATTFGYGPRFLHSTGQYHKGGPHTGLFLQITAAESEDAPIPGRPYTFGMLKRAQAQGDLEALHRHKRRAMRIDLGSDATKGLAALEETMKASPIPVLSV